MFSVSPKYKTSLHLYPLKIIVYPLNRPLLGAFRQTSIRPEPLLPAAGRNT